MFQWSRTVYFRIDPAIRNSDGPGNRNERRAESELGRFGPEELPEIFHRGVSRQNAELLRLDAPDRIHKAIILAVGVPAREHEHAHGRPSKHRTHSDGHTGMPEEIQASEITTDKHWMGWSQQGREERLLGRNVGGFLFTFRKPNC